MKTSGPIDATTLALPVAGLNLAPGTFADQLGGRPTLLVFLRHLG
jgi:hypothetical protein